MQVANFHLSELPILSPLLRDYLKGDKNLESCYVFPPSEKGFAQAIEARKKKPVNRQVLRDILLRSEKLSDETRLNIELIGENNTFTITTGHQLCIFTGPLYFVYKIVSCIALCRKLKKEFPQYNFIPVYWMASEDHDFAEVNHVHLFGEKIVWQSETTGPTGKIPLDNFREIITKFSILVEGKSHTHFHPDEIIQCYTSSSNLGEATYKLVNTLFGNYGLVTVNADNVEFKKQFRHIMKDELLIRNTFNCVVETNKRLKSFRYETQVSPREINLFYMCDGQRSRIVPDNGYYRIHETDLLFSENELLQELELFPERFSPNVLTRPLYQEFLLPNIAYIGGPGEIAYWLQCKNNFDAQGIFFPVLVLRDMAMLVTKKQMARLEKAGLEFRDLLLPKNEIVKKIVGLEKLLKFDEEKKLVEKTFEKISVSAKQIDATLEGLVMAEMKKQINAIDALEKRIYKAAKSRQSILITQIEKLHDELFPDGRIQERHDNFFQHQAGWSEDLIEQLLLNFDPLSCNFHFVAQH